jgi:NADP-dependent 3-hydroxy acid dehydrogenase YdfG
MATERKWIMLLENNVAVIYGAGGPVDSAVARTFAMEGARVFLDGRTLGKLDQAAAEIRSNGGATDTAVLDALDQRAVNEYVDAANISCAARLE